MPSDTHIAAAFETFHNNNRYHEMRIQRRLFELVIKEVRLRERENRKSGQLVDEDSVQCLNDTFFYLFPTENRVADKYIRN